jgi:Outer membrane protein beta-barrel domain
MSFKPYFLLIFLFFFLQKAEAQQRRFNAGLLLGFNMSQIHGDAEVGFNKLGFLGGLQAQINLKEKADIGLEIAFSQLGSRSTKNSFSFFPFKATLNYIAVPVYFKYKDWKAEDSDNEIYYRLHFLGGLSYGRLFSTKMEGFFEPLDGFLNDNYMGILVGALYHINPKLAAGARWEKGLLDIYNNDFDEGPNIERGRLIDVHLSVYLTYSFL